MTSRRWESEGAILEVGYHRHAFERQKADGVARMTAAAEVGIVVHCYSSRGALAQSQLIASAEVT